MISPCHLDHVAVAVEDQRDAWTRYAGDLAGRWVGGGGTNGFWSAQVEYDNGMKLEVLEPFEVERNDFLRRFLDRNGPGPHHLTFKVADLREAIDEAERAGYAPVGVDFGDEHWHEAFLHPKDAPGVVVQLAWSGGEWSSEPPDWFPSPRTSSPAELVHVAHLVADSADGLRLFQDLLGGEPVASGADAAGAFVDLAWAHGGRIRLITPRDGTDAAAWLGERRGRVYSVAFRCDRPEEVRDAHLVDGGDVFEVQPEANLGVRLHLLPR